MQFFGAGQPRRLVGLIDVLVRTHRRNRGTRKQPLRIFGFDVRGGVGIEEREEMVMLFTDAPVARSEAFVISVMDACARLKEELYGPQ